jgi:hypothetical protein
MDREAPDVDDDAPVGDAEEPFVLDEELGEEPLPTGVVILNAKKCEYLTTVAEGQYSQEVIELKSFARVPCSNHHIMATLSQAECTPCVRALGGGRETVNRDIITEV